MLAVEDMAESDMKHADLNKDGELDMEEVQKYQYPLMTEDRTPDEEADHEIKNLLHQVSPGSHSIMTCLKTNPNTKPVHPLLKLVSDFSEDGEVTTPGGAVEEWAASREQAKKHMEYFVEIHDAYPRSEL